MLLRSLTEKYLTGACFSPDVEGGADVAATLDTDTGNTDDSGDAGAVGDGPDGSEDASVESGGRLSVRDEIKKAMADASKEGQQQQKPKKTGFKKEAAAPPVDTQQQPTSQTIPAPERLSKEAKAEWDRAPETIKQAFVKAEQDMQRGVDELRTRYSGIDQALAPHQDALRQMNASPGEAVNRMFLWFKALAGNPSAAFPALAQSMGMDWNKLVTPQGTPQTQGQNPPAQQGQDPNAPNEFRDYIGRLESIIQQQGQALQQLQGGYGSIRQDIEQQQMLKTEENLGIWSKDKEYFNEVRQDMARLIQADPDNLIKNGQVDLDTAYERAIHYNPVVRAKVLSAQQQANQAVQQQAADAATTARTAQVAKARKAAVSLPAGNAPGANSAPAAKKPAGKLSVRDSIKAAMAELRDQ